MWLCVLLPRGLTVHLHRCGWMNGTLLWFCRTFEMTCASLSSKARMSLRLVNSNCLSLKRRVPSSKMWFRRRVQCSYTAGKMLVKFERSAGPLWCRSEAETAKSRLRFSTGFRFMPTKVELQWHGKCVTQYTEKLRLKLH